jgi:hypothetical protein
VLSVKEHLLRKPANGTTTEKRTTTDLEDDHITTGEIDRRMDVLAAVVLKAARGASPPCILVKFQKLSREETVSLKRPSCGHFPP